MSWFRNVSQSRSIFGAYFYYPPNASYQPPHNVNRETLVCDLYLYGSESQVTWFTLSYKRPPIEDHIAFDMVVKRLAVKCTFFQSELNRKKSQRALMQATEDQQNGLFLCL